MNVQKLFTMQKELDTSIQQGRNLAGEPLLERKLLAFHVETCELANETRCFKFWSSKPSADRSVILEEYVDGLHFLLSVGLELGFQDAVTESSQRVQTAEKPVTSYFHTVIDKIVQLRKDQTADTYEELFAAYAALGEALGFSPDDIEAAYFDKNKVNYRRQEEGY
ncbi:dUTP diphosphatase [Salisediminibacterium halotolerans]|uniref:Dimeric dUTPase, all-alpha-NTP-PPase (MazG) superfamily n=1 Tax=Salisediminibacterium halotolerans TaxID=517425 RepID=A0A1H9U053_9BACI|nr:dUTP diphosphatase [Salisediminibacterium haloalkalitolerans]SES03040.1 Dimeric dUTPase, all-alpha-NTP-PPase (MazG) superfamily [Salisediminibacterium haloalkalitolerans]